MDRSSPRAPPSLHLYTYKPYLLGATLPHPTTPHPHQASAWPACPTRREPFSDPSGQRPGEGWLRLSPCLHPLGKLGVRPGTCQAKARAAGPPRVSGCRPRRAPTPAARRAHSEPEEEEGEGEGSLRCGREQLSQVRPLPSPGCHIPAGKALRLC